jgi:hypothetical protein
LGWDISPPFVASIVDIPSDQDIAATGSYEIAQFEGDVNQKT